MPIVAVIFEGREWRLRVPPTPEGALRFQKQIELITGMPFDEQVGYLKPLPYRPTSHRQTA